MAGKKGQKKRFWSDDEKRSICAQTTVPGVSMAQVARRYAMNANLIHNWLKDPRFAPESEIADPDCRGGFLPVEIEGLHCLKTRATLFRLFRLSGLTSPCRMVGGFWLKVPRRFLGFWLWLKG